MNKETEFKIGDWVTTPSYGVGIIESITDCEYPFQVKHYPGRDVYNKEDMKHWQPQEGEWCWFYAHIEGEHLSLGKFLRRKGESYLYYDIALDKEVITFYCEPFIGTLPSIIKD